MQTSPLRVASTHLPDGPDLRLLAPLPFLDIDELAGRNHVMVDGAPRPGSVLVLSHWPVSTTPAPLARDLSAEIALAYLEEPTYWSTDAIAVTNDHPDVDGLTSIYALADPPAALDRAA